MAKGKDKTKQAPIFLDKVYDIVDRGPRSTVTWGKKGESFVIKDVKAFSKQILPRYFKHNKFTSFVRQLNFYGFRKLKHEEVLISKNQSEEENWWEFKHEHFARGKKDKMSLIKRRTYGDVPPERKEMDKLETKVTELEKQVATLTQTVEKLVVMLGDQNSVKVGVGAVGVSNRSSKAAENEVNFSANSEIGMAPEINTLAEGANEVTPVSSKSERGTKRKFSEVKEGEVPVPDESSNRENDSKSRREKESQKDATKSVDDGTSRENEATYIQDISELFHIDDDLLGKDFDGMVGAFDFGEQPLSQDALWVTGASFASLSDDHLDPVSREETYLNSADLEHSTDSSTLPVMETIEEVAIADMTIDKSSLVAGVMSEKETGMSDSEGGDQTLALTTFNIPNKLKHIVEESGPNLSAVLPGAFQKDIDVDHVVNLFRRLPPGVQKQLVRFAAPDLSTMVAPAIVAAQAYQLIACIATIPRFQLALAGPKMESFSPPLPSFAGEITA